MRLRERFLDRLRNRLSQRSYPRLQLSLIVIATGLAGFLASAGLLRLDFDHMGWRYLAAFGLAYAVFLLLVRLWAEYHRSVLESVMDLGDVVGVTNVPMSGGSLSTPGSDSPSTGASLASSHEPLATAVELSLETAELASADSGAASVADGLAGGLDLELWPIAGMIAIAAGVFIALAFVVFSAPTLLAEVMLDAAILGGVYRRVRKIPPENWIANAIHRTWIPASVICLFIVGLGFFLEATFPEARTIGQVLAEI